MKIILVVCLIIYINIFPGISLAQFSPDEIGVDEKTGQLVPLDLRFRNEVGDTVTLRGLIDKPTILSLVYFRCPGICPHLLSGMTDVISKLNAVPGKDYVTLTISFDETDTPDAAREMKKNYLTPLGPKFPQDTWHFLTGDTASIRQITHSVGFKYKQVKRDYVHVSTLVILSPEGKITRYLNGTTFLPFDLKMALLEASEGRVGPTINKVLQFCFSYDPDGRNYVFNFTRVSGVLILFFAGIFFMVLILKGRIRKRNKR